MKIPADAVLDTIRLRGKDIEVRVCVLPQRALLFYPENPRIYTEVHPDGDETPSQEVIFEVMSREEHVRESLVPSIRDNGGLIEPILVRGNVVLEGNSRLAAYRLLAQSDPEKWKFIRARVLPEDLDDSSVFSLLGEFHMVGKKDWRPYEQAGYLYRRHKVHEMQHEDLAKEVGLAKSKVAHLIRVYDFMVRHEERAAEKWSYYDELLKGRRLSSAVEQYPNFYEVVAQKIISKEIDRAMDLRDDLPKIVRASGKTLRRFMDGKLTFQEAVEEAENRGAGNVIIKKLKDFRVFLAAPRVDDEVSGAPPVELDQIKFELNKLKSRITQLHDRAAKNPQKP